MFESVAHGCPEVFTKSCSENVHTLYFGLIATENACLMLYLWWLTIGIER